MTSDEFERGYAARAGVTVDELHRRGRFAEPCSCDYERCEGWALGYQWEEASIENELLDEALHGQKLWRP